MPTLRHLYPGGNTSLGFYSHFDQILPFEKARRIYILKGGPGVGKSTFMRKIGAHLMDRGFDIEHIHCASDNDSLDGVLAPAIGLLFVDGTAPHIVDPKWPGAVDGIINLGDCLDEDGLCAYKQEIGSLSAEISEWFASAYRFLVAAGSVRADTASIVCSNIDPGGLRKTASKLVQAFLPPVQNSPKPAQERKMFATAITPGGVVCELLSQHAAHLVSLAGLWTAPTDRILAELRDAALRRGLSAEGYYCALNPSRLEHLFIPALGTLFFTANSYHGYDIAAEQTFDLNEYTSVPQASERDRMARNETLFETLLTSAVEALGQAKSSHDALEKYYVRHMNFAKADRMLQQTLQKIEPLLHMA